MCIAKIYELSIFGTHNQLLMEQKANTLGGTKSSIYEKL